jgi:hypothetical protein
MNFKKLLKKPRVRLKGCAREGKEWVERNWKNHLSDCVSMISSTTPIFIAFETNAGKLLGKVPYLDAKDLNDDLSLAARMKIFKWSLLGLAYAYMGLNKVSRKVFNVDDKSSEFKQVTHDAIYTIGFNGVVAPLLYYASGARDLGEILAGTAIAMALAVPVGPLMRYSAGVGRDLLGLEKYERKTYPILLRERSNYVKKAVYAGLVGASVGLSELFYSMTDSKFGENERFKVAQMVSKLENIVD